MTGDKILQDALLYSGIDGYNVQEPIAVDYINRAIDIIARDYDEVGQIKEQEYNIGNEQLGVWLDLPSDFLVLRRVYWKGATPTLSYAAFEPNDFLIQNDRIRFDVAQDYTMEYVPYPTYLENILREPSISPVWHPAMSYYVAYRIKASVFGDEEGEKDELYVRFDDYCKRAAGRLNRRKRRRRVKAPMWG